MKALSKGGIRMRRWLFCMSAAFSAACLLFAWHWPAAGEQGDIQDFKGALEKQMENTVHYYHEDSAEIKDFIAVNGDVVKTIQTDDSSTPENEEKIEEYSSRVAVAFVEYEL
jgi:hypothetical protein